MGAQTAPIRFHTLIHQMLSWLVAFTLLNGEIVNLCRMPLTAMLIPRFGIFSKRLVRDISQ
jgi:hypothetical protein